MRLKLMGAVRVVWYEVVFRQLAKGKYLCGQSVCLACIFYTVFEAGRALI